MLLCPFGAPLVFSVAAKIGLAIYKDGPNEVEHQEGEAASDTKQALLYNALESENVSKSPDLQKPSPTTHTYH